MDRLEEIQSTFNERCRHLCFQHNGWQGFEGRFAEIPRKAVAHYNKGMGYRLEANQSPATFIGSSFKWSWEK